MTFAKLNDSGLDAALDIIAPRLDDRDADEDMRVALAYATGRINL